MKNLFVVVADTNDADYITNISEVSNEDLEQIKGIISKMRSAECNERYNEFGLKWPTSEYADETLYELYEDILTEDEIDFLSEYIPFGEYGVHTIEVVYFYKDVGDKIYV